MKVLNLYACLGGNRYLWDNCEVTAVELDPELAKLYQERFPNDTVIVADAHQYLLDHYKEFDFIWSSPPCPTHSRFNWSMKTVWNMRYPDMKLYEEIIFLDTWFEGKWVVENVIPYYKPLIKATELGRHLYWSNFRIPKTETRKNPELSRGTAKEILDRLIDFHGYDFRRYKGKQDVRKVGRNLVDYEVGKYIFDIARKSHDLGSVMQNELF